MLSIEAGSEERISLDVASQGSKRSAAWQVLPPILMLVVLIAAVEFAVKAEAVSELIIPAPSSVGKAFVELFNTGIVWEHMNVTVTETLIGFGIGAGSGFLLGVIASLSGLFRQVSTPYVVVFQVTPRVALAPVFLTWFGFGMASKIVMAATICFFPVFVNTVTGLLNVDSQAMELFRSLKASRRQLFWHLTLPSALPVVFAGLKTAMTLALIGAIVAEFVGTSAGLGLLIDRFNFQLATDSAFAVILLLALIGLVLYGVMELLDRKLVFWDQGRRNL